LIWVAKSIGAASGWANDAGGENAEMKNTTAITPVNTRDR
jgi:hypothetical protein